MSVIKPRSYVLLFICGILTLSCSRISPELRFALEYSGKNRTELEKVLQHYSEKPADSLKLKAALFLIENMPGHFSSGGEALEKYYAATDSIFTNPAVTAKREAMEANVSKYAGSIETLEDIKVITADYLISNIDSAYKVWRTAPHARHVLFGDFCEYILPYKAAQYQPFEHWRDSFRMKYRQPAENIIYHGTFYKESAHWACSYLNYNIRSQIPRPQWESQWFPILKPTLLARTPPGTCDGYTLIAASVMRSHGVPVAIDFTPQWPFLEMGHSWNVVLTNSGKNVVFSGVESEPGQPHKCDEKMAKVFRETYAINRELLQLNRESRWVPPVLTNVFVKDVTSDYMVPVDVTVEVLPELRQEAAYAYLALFSIRGWNPIQWGKIKRGRVVFKEMGKDEVYLPVYFTKNGVEPFSYPVLLNTRGEIRVLKPDTLVRQTLILKRKYHINRDTHEGARRLIDGTIEGSNDPDFRSSDTIHQFKTLTYNGTIPVRDTNRYRYWRYHSPWGGSCNIAELMFFGEEESRQLKGKIIGTDGSFCDDPLRRKEVVFDGDPLTFFDGTTGSDDWAGMDFGRPVRMSKIIYISRTDDNGIRLGDTYELFYWGIKGWKSLGKQTATEFQLTYRHVPTNALFWLRDLTRGQEERPFTWENGEQLWW